MYYDKKVICSFYKIKKKNFCILEIYFEKIKKKIFMDQDRFLDVR